MTDKKKDRIKVVITDPDDDKVTTIMYLNVSGIDEDQIKYNFNLTYGEVKLSVQHSPKEEYEVDLENDEARRKFKYRREDDIPPRIHRKKQQ